MPTLTLYLAMFYRVNTAGGDIFHWGFIGSIGESYVLFQARQNPSWIYEVRSIDPLNSLNLVAMLQVGAWKASSLDELSAILYEVPLNHSVNEPNITWACNVWAADALRVLNQKGTVLVSLQMS